MTTGFGDAAIFAGMVTVVISLIEIIKSFVNKTTQGNSAEAMARAVAETMHQRCGDCKILDVVSKTDEDGTPLGIMEIRDRIVRRAPLRVSNTIHMAHAALLGKRLLKRLYIWYLSKNIFRIDCPVRSEPDYEKQPSGRTYLHLIPDGYHDEWLEAPRVTQRGNTIR